MNWEMARMGSKPFCEMFRGAVDVEKRLVRSYNYKDLTEYELKMHFKILIRTIKREFVKSWDS